MVIGFQAEIGGILCTVHLIFLNTYELSSCVFYLKLCYSFFGFEETKVCNFMFHLIFTYTIFKLIIFAVFR